MPHDSEEGAAVVNQNGNMTTSEECPSTNTTAAYVNKPLKN